MTSVAPALPRTHKWCKRCDVKLPVEAFFKPSCSPTDLNTWCRPCNKEYSAEKYLIRKGLAVRLPPRPAIDRRCSRCEERLPLSAFSAVKPGGPEAVSAWCKACSYAYKRSRMDMDPKSMAERAAYHRKWSDANREKVRAYGENHRRAHAGEVRLSKQRWYEENQDRWRSYSLKRVAIKKAATVIDFSSEQLDQRMAYFGNKCWMCRGPFEHVDHVKPLSKGGLHGLSNLRPACKDCNLRKHAKWYGPQELHRFIKN
jgi:5-methylcytosine-specific restriction endonuclease McrA